MDNNSIAQYVVTIVVSLIFLGIVISFGPVFSIWALNTLFDLAIPINFTTWLAMLWLSLIVVVRARK